jgi:hypothetical protein
MNSWGGGRWTSARTIQEINWWCNLVGRRRRRN